MEYGLHLRASMALVQSSIVLYLPDKALLAQSSVFYQTPIAAAAWPQLAGGSYGTWRMRRF
jgi:hypothetical protein